MSDKKSKHKHPRLASKPLVGLGVAFYGKRYFKKQVKLISDGSLKKLEPPYIIVANHSGFADVGGLITQAYPNCINFVISLTQIVKWPKMIKYMGILPKKQFSVDTTLIRDIKYVLSKNRIVAVYPEAKLSVVGTPNIIKPNIAKLVKLLKAPLVTVCFNGSYLHKPRWAKSKRRVPVTMDVKLAVSQDEISSITVDEIHRRIIDNLTYDDYAYQLANGIEIDVPDLVEGLEGVLYKCPTCNTEFAMSGRGHTLTCTKCGAQVTQDKLGRLEGCCFDKVTDWYLWQTECARNEVAQSDYCYSGNFRAEKLVGSNYVDIGEAVITHNAEGITATLNSETLHYKAGAFYTLSFNNDYVYLPTAEAVYRFKQLENLGCTTKLNLAVEQQTILLENK
ncbi:MAG: 1-acyl-sn-glycerol-3-phosphate acyltransferase [Firmicutes bacterium]|nr:1-acyl-sn-glycerol-3-phosphate acyltransferase [Bacillota bacterium]